MKLTVETATKYDVLIEGGLLKKAPLELLRRFGKTKTLVVADSNVYALYGEKLVEALNSAGINAFEFVFPAGEQSKSVDNFIKICERLAEYGFTRNDILIALGGGVTGDLGGFASSAYMRGIRYVQIPTTLLAMVDSSVGGKTAIDFKEHKNLIGAFWQPSLVLCDTGLLKTLPERHIKNGFAEIIKAGFIFDKALLKSLNISDALIYRSVKIKSDIVKNDEYDKGIRQILNFGHTFGHAIEGLSGFNILHGEAVAMGMGIMLRSFGCAEGVKILENNGFTTVCPFGAEEIIEYTRMDKKNTGNGINIVGVKSLGKAEIINTDFEELKNIFMRGNVK